MDEKQREHLIGELFSVLEATGADTISQIQEGGLKSLAAMCFISPSYLSALFKQETGSTLIDYINTQRVNRAAQLLVQNNHTIAAVAEEVGILDVNYFTKIFKKTLGVTPTRYRREHKEK